MLRDLPHQCGFCGQWVLALFGQDSYLPPYAIRGTIDNQDAVEVRGLAHAVCVRKAGLLAEWIRLNKALHFQLEGTQLLYEREDLVVLWIKHVRQFVILSEGDEIRLTRHDLSRARVSQAGQVSVPLEQMVVWNLKKSILTPEKVAWQLRRNGSIPLLDIVAGFGVKDRLLRPEALRRSRVMPLEEDSATTWSEFSFGSLCGTAQYGFSLNLSLGELKRIMAV